MHAHNLAPNLGIQGENLLKLVLMHAYGRKITDLAVQGSQFHHQSLVHGLFIDVTACGDNHEFDMTPFELLQDPLNTLKQKFINMADNGVVKPDGLTLLTNVVNEYFISAWQSKNWNKRLGAKEVEEALKSLDPDLFFSQDSADQNEWQNIKNPQHWMKYIRVSCQF